MNPSSRGNANTPTSTNTIDSPIHTPGSPTTDVGFECVPVGRRARARPPRRTRTRGAGSDARVPIDTQGTAREPGCVRRAARPRPDALALEVRDEPGGVKRRLRRVDAGARGPGPASAPSSRSGSPSRTPRRQPRETARSSRAIGTSPAPPELPATRTSITSRSDGSPSAAERRFRTAASASRGTTGPLEVMTGPATRGPRARGRPLVDRSRQREPPTHVADPGIVREGGRLRVQRVHRRLRADRLGEGPIDHTRPGLHLAQTAVLEHHRRQGEFVQDRLRGVRTPNSPPPSDRSMAPFTRSIDRTEPSSSRSAPRRARTFVMPRPTRSPSRRTGPPRGTRGRAPTV